MGATSNVVMTESLGADGKYHGIRNGVTFTSEFLGNMQPVERITRDSDGVVLGEVVYAFTIRALSLQAREYKAPFESSLDAIEWIFSTWEVVKENKT